MREAWTKTAGSVRAISLTIALGGLTVLALSFLARVAAQGGFNANDVKGTYAFRMVPVKSFSSDNSVLSGLAAAPYQDILRVGVLTATPDVGPGATHGTLSGKTIATIDNNSGSTRVVVFSWTGHYGINPDGTGVFTVEALGPTLAGYLPATSIKCFDSADNAVVAPAVAPPYPPPPPAQVGLLPGGQTCDFGLATSVEGPESYAFVISKGHHDLQFIETDNGPGGGAKIFLTGRANRQLPED